MDTPPSSRPTSSPAASGCAVVPGVFRPGGRIAFYTIFVPPGLTGRDRRRASRAGPPAVAGSSAYRNLLRSARFVEVDEVDVTAAYLDTALLTCWLLWEGRQNR